MTQIRFGKLIVLACMGLAVACTTSTDSGTAGNTELNLDIVNPGATSGELGFTVDRVDYRITCPGNPGADIAPRQYTGSPPDYNACDVDADCVLGSVCSTSADAAAISSLAGLCAIPYNYDDSVDITGQFEIVDTRVPPVWQAVMDLPPGLCQITLSVSDTNGEVVCIGNQELAITEDGLTKYDIVLVCSLSIDLPDGMADVDGEFLFVTGNLCPKTYTLNAIPSVVPLAAIPPLSEIQFRAKDPDDGCGNNCDPQICTGNNPAVCSPSVYNPNDARCSALAGGGLLCAENTPGAPAFCPLCDPLNPLFGLAGVINPCCWGFDYTGFGGPNVPAANGTVCTIVATPTFSGFPGGTFLNPLDGVTPVGPVLPVNISDALNDGTDIHIQGIDADYICDSAQPGNVDVVMHCSDGDEQCDQFKQIVVTCPGVNFCDDFPVPGDCLSPTVCQTDGTCDPTCDPLDVCDRCPGLGTPTFEGGACSDSGGQICDNAGNCVECTGDAQCGVLPAPPVSCQENNTCNVGSNLCEAGGTSPAGTPCDRGGGQGPGECDGLGTGFGACEFVIVPQSDSADIVLGCTNNLTVDVSILPWTLDADAPLPLGIVDGSPTTITYTGTAFFTETFLDAGLAAVPGLDQAALQQGNRGGATIVPKAGLIGPNVEIEPAPIPLTCDGGMNAGGSCVVSSECPPIGYFNCTEVVQIPTIDGTGDACAACNALGIPKNTQCADNGFCIAPGGLPIPLDTVVGNYTAVANADDVLIGWDETNQNGTNADGTYILFPASFGAPWQPGGLRVVVGVLQIALNCVMAVDSGGPNGVGVPDQASPTPNSALMTGLSVQVP